MQVRKVLKINPVIQPANSNARASGRLPQGFNAPRQAMIRIRRAADAGAAERGLGLPALLDLHTGREPTPDACSYASHYPMVDSVQVFDSHRSPFHPPHHF